MVSNLHGDSQTGSLHRRSLHAGPTSVVNNRPPLADFGAHHYHWPAQAV